MEQAKWWVTFGVARMVLFNVLPQGPGGAGLALVGDLFICCFCFCVLLSTSVSAVLF